MKKIIEAIDRFEDRANQADYTDTGNAWELLDWIRETLRAETKGALKILICDVTEYWSGSITKHTGRIFDVYLYDPQQVTYCASLTPTYECHFVESFIENPWSELPAFVAQEIETQEAQQRYEVKYYVTWTVDKAEKLQTGSLPAATLTTKDFYINWEPDSPEAMMDEAIQALRETGI